MGGLSGLILAWANELTGYDNESAYSLRWFTVVVGLTVRSPERAFVIASCNTFAYMFRVRFSFLRTKRTVADQLLNSLGMAPDVSDERKWPD